MWYLVSLENPDVKYILICGKEYIVGRKDCDIQVSSDASVSRKHAQLTVSHSEAKLAHPGNLPILTIKDLSKFGTWKNKEKIQGQTFVQDGDELMFGSQKSVYTAVYEPFVVTVSCLDKASKQTVRQLVCKVGGHVVAEWRRDCSYLIMNSISVTIKVVCAMLAQKPIVSPDYLEQYVRFLQKEITSSPNPNHFIPQVSETQVDPSDVSFAVNPERKNIFQGKTFIFLQKKQFEKMTLAVELGGGTPMLMEEKPAERGEDRILTEEGSLVMSCPFDNAAPPKWKDWHRHVLKTLTRHKKHMIQDSELGYAVMFCSTEKHCNPDIASQMPIKHLPSQSLSQAPDFSCLENSSTEKIKVKQEVLTPQKPGTSQEKVSHTTAPTQLKQSSKLPDRNSVLNFKDEKSSPAASTRSRSPGPNKTSSPSPIPKPQNKKDQKSPSPVSSRHQQSKSPSPVPNRRHQSKSPSPVPNRRQQSKSPSPVSSRRQPSRSPSPTPSRRSRRLRVSESPPPVSSRRQESKSSSPVSSRRSKRHTFSKSPSPEIQMTVKNSRKMKVEPKCDTTEKDSSERQPQVTIKTEKNSKRKNTIAEDSDDDFGFSSKRFKKTIAEDSDDDFGCIRKKPSKSTEPFQCSERDTGRRQTPKHKSDEVNDETVSISNNKGIHGDDSDDDFGPSRGKKKTKISPGEVKGIDKSQETARNKDEKVNERNISQIKGEKHQTPAKNLDLITMETEVAPADSGDDVGSPNRQERRHKIPKTRGHTDDRKENGCHPPAGFLTSRRHDEEMETLKKDTGENELPSNLVVTKFVDLVCHPSREVSHKNGDAEIPEGFTKWKNRIVKNFKKFKKAQNIRLPNIIGGSDLVPHIGTQRKEIEDWFREAQQMESQQAEADREASELFDWQPQAGTKRSRR